MSVFEVIRGVEGCCLALDNTRIAGPKPWGGGAVIHAWETDEEYKAVDTQSRWHEMFGTPERTAWTLETVADSLFSSAWSDDNATLSDVMCALVGKCDECVAQGLPGRGVSTKCGEVDYDALLEWLKGTSE